MHKKLEIVLMYDQRSYKLSLSMGITRGVINYPFQWESSFLC